MQGAVKAGVRGVMAAYNEIDGIYCHANRKLLTELLRNEFGFDGIVMADALAIDQLDKMTGDGTVSAGLALLSLIHIYRSKKFTFTLCAFYYAVLISSVTYALRQNPLECSDK